LSSGVAPSWVWSPKRQVLISYECSMSQSPQPSV